MKYDKVHQMYNKFLALPDVDPTLVSLINSFGILFKCLKPIDMTPDGEFRSVNVYRLLGLESKTFL